MERGTCVFCGVEGDLSEEDLIPKWANVILRRLAGGNDVLYSTRQVDVANEGAVLGSVSRRRQSYSAVKLPKFCEQCNNTWMSRIENDAKPLVEPMIYGQRVGFTGRDLHALAKWLVLKTLVADLIDHGYPTAGDEEFQWFYEHMDVPEGFVARVGYFDHSKQDVCFFNLEPLTAGQNLAGLKTGDPVALQFSLSFGPAWFQALLIRRAAADYPRFVNDCPNPYWTQLWPPRSNVNWPPPLRFKRENLPGILSQWPEVDAWVRTHIGDE